MRFQQLFLFAPALLVAAQNDNNDSSSNSITANAPATLNDNATGATVTITQTPDSSASSSGGGALPDGIITTLFGGGQATLVTTRGGEIIGTITGGAAQLASTIHGGNHLNGDIGTLVSSVPFTTVTTSLAPGQENKAQATAAPYVAGGLLGAGIMAVGML